MVENKSSNDKEKEQIILEAARKRFSYFGLTKTTMTEIASDVGLSKASLYYYFPDKESLFRAVVKQDQDAFLGEVTEMLKKKGSVRKRITDFVDARHQYFIRTFMNLGQLKLSIDTVKPMLANLIEVFEAKEKVLVAQLFDEGVASGEFEKIETPVYADLFISMLVGVRMITLKRKDACMLGEEDFAIIQGRVSKLVSIFIKGISKNN